MSLTDPQQTPLSQDNQTPSELSEKYPPRAAPSADVRATLAAYGAVKLDDLRAGTNLDKPWLWDGYLPRGGVTLLTGLWKAGKTTLVAVLLDRLCLGGTLAGRAVQPGKAVVVSEESHKQWRTRADKWPFGDHITWLCRPFRGKPAHDDWLDLIDRLTAVHRHGELDLLVIDSLAAFLPGRDENSAALMLHALMPLQRLTSRGATVLLAHHPRKHASPAGMAARGSGALPAFVDVLIEMERFDPKDEEDRRRRLRASSRSEETPRHAVIELDSAGADYLFLGDTAQAEFADGWERVRRVLEQAPCKLRRDEMLEDWPADDLPAPGDTSLRRWLDEAFADGRAAREGAGTRNHPHLYWLPGREVEWPDDSLWFLNETEEPFDPVQMEKETIRQERRKRARS